MDYNSYNAMFKSSVQQVTNTSSARRSNGNSAQRSQGFLGEFFDRLLGTAHTTTVLTPTTDRPPVPNRVINVYDATASAGSQIMDTNVESFRVSEGGNKVYVEKINVSRVRSFFGL